MKVITTTEARKQLPVLINQVHYNRRVIAIGRRQQAEVLIIPFPEHYNPEFSEMTNMNQYGGAFQWLEEEPNLYTHQDLKKSYV